MKLHTRKPLRYQTKPLAIAIGCAMLSLGTVASASQFTSVYFFGDSLSDSGQNPDTSTSPIKGLRFTNRTGDGLAPNPTALVWTQHLTTSLGLDIRTANASNPLIDATPGSGIPDIPRQMVTGDTPGNNYAVAGYVSSFVANSISGATMSSYDSSANVVSSGPGYLASSGGIADPDALYVVWAGGNDVLGETAAVGGGQTPEDAADNVATAATTLAGAGGIQALASAGAKNIFVFNLPDLGKVPGIMNLSGGALSPVATTLSDVYNATLTTSLQASGINVVIGNVNALFTEIIANPAAYGYATAAQLGVSNIYDTCFSGGSVYGGALTCTANANYGVGSGSPDASKLLFNDPIHPTTTTHQALASYALSILSAPGQISSMSYYAVNRAEALNTAEHAIKTGDKAFETGALQFTGGVSASTHADTHELGTVGSQGDTQSAYATISTGLSKQLSIGAMIGTSSSTDDWTGGGHLDTDNLYFGVFASGSAGKLEGDVVLAQSQLDFDSDRRIQLASATRAEKGSTSGDMTSLQLNLRFNVAGEGNFSAGPAVGIRSQRISVDSFVEQGNTSTTMGFDQQKVDSLQYEIGLYARASAPDSALKPKFWISGTRITETEDQPFSLRAGLKSLPDNIFSLQGFELGESLNRFEAGLALQPLSNLQASLTASSQHGNTADHTARGLTLRIEGKF